MSKNFPFPQKRQRQDHILKEICDAFNSGYKRIILEAPTGFGKSPLAVSFALTLGTSYICTSTKDLQSQYANDFSYLKVAKGKSNFPCLVKEDFIREGKYRCKICLSPAGLRQSNSLKEVEDLVTSECKHTSVEYGPCMTDEAFRDNGCKYRTFPKDYTVIKKGTKNESVFIPLVNIKDYRNNYSKWLHLKNFNTGDSPITDWRACPYFDQLNIALSASHSIFNYSSFLALIPSKKNLLSRELLVLDEGHLLETELVKFRGLTISKRRWKRYVSDLKIVDFGFDDIKRWIDFLIELETKMLNLLGNSSVAESLAIERKVKYRWSTNKKKKSNENNNRIVSSSDLFESDEQISKQYEDLSIHANNTLTDEVAADAIRDTERLTRTISNVISDPENWIVSDVIKENYEVVKVEFKPLDISKYCKAVFDKCSKTIIMSATILNYNTFCRNIGISPENDEVKFIQVPSDFPVENRPIYPMNVAYLNYNNLQLQETKSAITNAIDNLMTIHNKHKGIIHTTSYEQLNFIKDNISKDNARRLIVTDPEIQREEVVQEHFYAKKPTVLISPSLHTGLDLKEDLSRFQIITKVPYPNKSDRWINAKRNKVPEWYYWQTGLKLVQAYGRSVRSKDDWARTYILDSAFQYFLRKNRGVLPGWFLNAIKNYNLS
ncbi:MAG: helicase C-terminal domain-containing protein [Ignavibacteriales bacterium]